MRLRPTTAYLALAVCLAPGCYSLPQEPPPPAGAGSPGAGAGGTSGTGSTEGGTSAGGTPATTGGTTSTGGSTATGGSSATGGAGGAGSSTGGSNTGGAGGAGAGGTAGNGGAGAGGAGAGGTAGKGGAGAGGAGAGGTAGKGGAGAGGAGAGGAGMAGTGGGAIVELARGRTATADSEENNTTSNPPKVNLAGNAVDGSGTTRWCAANAGQHYWTVDLGASHTLSRIEVDFEYPTAAVGLAYGYTIGVSPDGTTFATAINQTANTSTTTTQIGTFPAATSGRYVRVTVIPPTTTPATWSSFWEARVYGQ